MKHGETLYDVKLGEPAKAKVWRLATIIAISIALASSAIAAEKTFNDYWDVATHAAGAVTKEYPHAIVITDDKNLTVYIFTLIAINPKLAEIQLFGALATVIVSGGLGGAIGFYFGSSQSSSKKDEVVANLASKTPDQSK